MKTRTDRIELALQAGLQVLHLEVLNESHNHSGPADAQSHFKVVLVSPSLRDSRVSSATASSTRLCKANSTRACMLWPFTPIQNQSGGPALVKRR